MAGVAVRGPGGPETGRGFGARRDRSALESGPANRLGNADLRPWILPLFTRAERLATRIPAQTHRPALQQTSDGNGFYLQPTILEIGAGGPIISSPAEARDGFSWP